MTIQANQGFGVSVFGAVSSGGGGTPGGLDTQVQFNSSGSFGASANLTFMSPALTIGTQQTTQGKIVFANTAGGAFATTVQSSNSASAAWTLTLPTTAGTANYALTTNGSGVSSWSQISLTAGVTDVLPVANGGTNASSASITAFNNITGYTASGATGTTSTNLVFSTSPNITTPTFTTSATGPLFIGGAGTTSTLTLRSTSGVGTTGADIIFQAGNNGATECMRILNNGRVGIGTSAPSGELHIQASSFLVLTLQNGNGAANNKTWDWLSNGSTLSLRAVNDAYSVAETAYSLTRSGTAVQTQVWSTAATERLRMDASGNVVVSAAALATTATDGFLYVPTCAGVPTGVPTAYAGRAPIVIDTTNNRLYFRSGGAWQNAGP